MTVQELILKDKSFNSEIFIVKANDMIKRVYNALALDELDKINHFISDRVYKKLETQLNSVKANDCQLVYDDLITNVTITDIRMDLDSYRIITSVRVNCLRYIKSKKDGSVVGGNVNSRSSLTNEVVFKRKKNVEERVTNRCYGCGTTFDINQSGICPVCGRVYDLEEIDYYIDEFE